MVDNKDITIKEAAEILGVTERTVWRYIKKGLLETTKWEDRTLVDRDAVLVLKTKGEIVQAVQVQSYNPETHVIVERTHYEKLLDAGAAFAEGAEKATERIMELTSKIAQLEVTNAALSGEQTKLIEDKRAKEEVSEKTAQHIAELTSEVARLEAENARLAQEQKAKEEKVPWYRRSIFSFMKKKEPTWGEKVAHARKLHGGDP